MTKRQIGAMPGIAPICLLVKQPSLSSKTFFHSLCITLPTSLLGHQEPQNQIEQHRSTDTQQCGNKPSQTNISCIPTKMLSYTGAYTGNLLIFRTNQSSHIQIQLYFLYQRKNSKKNGLEMLKKAILPIFKGKITKKENNFAANGIIL